MIEFHYSCEHEDEESAQVNLTCECGNPILDHKWILHDSVFVCTECDRKYVARWKGMVIEPVKQKDPESIGLDTIVVLEMTYHAHSIYDGWQQYRYLYSGDIYERSLVPPVITSLLDGNVYPMPMTMPFLDFIDAFGDTLKDIKDITILFANGIEIKK